MILNSKSNADLIEKINKLKKKKCCCFGHCYQNVEIDEVADFVGDSLYLTSRRQNRCGYNRFCGVYFMAETAKILSQTEMLLPSLNQLFYADMINLEQIKNLKHKTRHSVVCYVNSTAEVSQNQTSAAQVQMQ
jgi:quinolinate synthase